MTSTGPVRLLIVAVLALFPWTASILLAQRADSDLRLWIRTGPPGFVEERMRIVDPGLPFDLPMTFFNDSGTDARDVTLTLEVPRGAGFVDLPDFCSAMTDQTVRCFLDIVPADRRGARDGVADLTLRVVAPDDPTGSTIEGIASVHVASTGRITQATFESRMFRTFYVTRSDDSGEGSLRAAVHDIGSACGDQDACKIAFRIPEAGPWATISPESPLPPVIGSSVWIDATTQTRFFGDLNAAGPEIELDGSRLDAGDGLVIATRCNVEVQGLAINGFPGAGILAAGTSECSARSESPWTSFRVIRDSFLGTDPTGMRAVPNMRGIIVAYADVFAPGSFAFPGAGAYRILRNVISGNTRAGIFSVSGTELVAQNTIGLNRDRTGGLGNGASGLYVGPHSHGMTIEGNFIGFNRDFGIAVDGGAQFVSMPANSIQANWQGGIDIGLNGTTRVIPWIDGGRIHLPVIDRAEWDPLTESTVIEGVLPEIEPAALGHEIAIYASDAPDASGYGEGQYVLGQVRADDDGAFVLRFPVDLRGKWVSATATRKSYLAAFARPAAFAADRFGFVSATTEFGRSVLVH